MVTNQSFNAETGTLAAICATADSGSCDGATANFSYQWDAIGNLTDRADTYEGYTEYFCYDALNRLTNYAVGTSCTAAGSGDTAKTVGYDALGDITSKSDVGTYSYPASGSSSVQPHAVSGITGTVNGVVNPTFTYDADGNMTAGDGRTMTWTSFNMAAPVTEGTTSSAFVYDGNQARLQQCVPNCTSPTTTTTYFNESLTGSMEERVVSGSTTTWHDYIKTDTGIVAELFTTSGTTTPYYFNGDHLGSTSVLTNASGAVTERDSYDAWGKRRNPNGTDNTACSITSTSLRGYTGQEMMDPVCLINLNARLYDPTIARVMSADPTIPDPFDGQSINRYSYANNGPLSATDPSGYDSQNQLPPAYQSNPCQNECGGVPCYTCTGPGLVNDNGYPTPASEYASGTWNVTENFIDGSSSTQTYHTPAALFAALNGIETINSDYGFGTTFQFELPGLTGSIVYAGNSIEVIDGGQSVTEYGAGLHSVDLEGDTNGGYNNGVYYGGVGPTLIAANSPFTKAEVVSTLVVVNKYIFYLGDRYQYGMQRPPLDAQASDLKNYNDLQNQLTIFEQEPELLQSFNDIGEPDFMTQTSISGYELYGAAVNAGLIPVNAMPPSNYNMFGSMGSTGIPDPAMPH